MPSNGNGDLDSPLKETASPTSFLASLEQFILGLIVVAAIATGLMIFARVSYWAWTGDWF